MSLPRTVRRLILGEAGLAPALVLAGVALVVAFISVAGARALLTADNTASRQALRLLPAIDRGLMISADLQAWPKTGVLPPADVSEFSHKVLGTLPRRPDFIPAQDWSGVSLPYLTVTNPAPSAVIDLPPLVEAVYRTGLAALTSVVAGSLPDAAGPVGRPRMAGRLRSR